MSKKNQASAPEVKDVGRESASAAVADSVESKMEDGQGGNPVKTNSESEPEKKEAEAKPEPKKETRRERKKGVGVSCPKCGKDAFVTHTRPPNLPRTHPSFIEQRVRYLRCGSCEHAFKG